MVKEVDINAEQVCGIMLPSAMPSDVNAEQVLEAALDHPVGTEKLESIVKKDEKIAIITSDITRPVPTATILPLVLKRLWAAGVSPGNVTVVFALGIHRCHTPEEQRKLLGTAAESGIAYIDSCSEGSVEVGVTSKGTPVEINRIVAEADRRICIGNVEYHYFAGYSGGGKAIMPGVSTARAIRNNHRYMLLPEATTARIEGNPVREDIEEAARIVGVDFIVNVVLNEHKKIAYAVSGDMIRAHREACRLLDQHYRCPIAKPADIVIVSQGGAPKDLNLYQMQKALDNAKFAVREGGTIILVGSCKEGFGEKTFESWIRAAKTPNELINHLHKDFQLGGHKAAAIALVRKKADILFVSDMPKEITPAYLLQSVGELQDAYDLALQKHGPNASVILMPYGGSTLPAPM